MIILISILYNKHTYQTAPASTPTSQLKFTTVTLYLYKKYGAIVFFRGISVVVARAIPVNALTFYFYEYFKSLGDVNNI